MSSPTVRVAVAGAAGRMGATVCAAVSEASDMELVARADPALGITLAEALAEQPEVLVDFTLPATAVQNAREALAAGVHVVIGTTGFDPEQLDEIAKSAQANVFIAPNFAIGAVLMMQFAQQAARHMARAEIIELHHDRKLDKPSGTAARTASLMAAAAPEIGEPLGQASRARRPPGGDPRRRRPDADDPPRLNRPSVVHARRAAGDPQGRNAERVADGRARAAAVSRLRPAQRGVTR